MSECEAYVNLNDVHSFLDLIVSILKFNFSVLTHVNIVLVQIVGKRFQTLFSGW